MLTLSQILLFFVSIQFLFTLHFFLMYYLTRNTLLLPLLDPSIKLIDGIVRCSFIYMYFTACTTKKVNFNLPIGNDIVRGIHLTATGRISISWHFTVYMQRQKTLRTVVSRCLLRRRNIFSTSQTYKSIISLILHRQAKQLQYAQILYRKILLILYLLYHMHVPSDDTFASLYNKTYSPRKAQRASIVSCDHVIHHTYRETYPWQKKNTIPKYICSRKKSKKKTH